MSSRAEISPGADKGSESKQDPRSLDALCQQAILALVLFILVWAPLAFGSTGPVAFLVIQAVTALVIALWAIRWWAQRPFRLLWPPVCWAVLVFLLYALCRCQLVDVQYVGHQQLTRVIVYAALFFAVLNNLNRRESATIVAMTLVIVAFALAFVGVVQFARHMPAIWGVTRPAQYINRASGTFINPNNFAAYLEAIVPLTLAYAMMSRFGAITKVLLAYAALAMLAGIAASISRGGILAIAAALVLFCLTLLAQRDCWLPALVTLAGLLLAGLVCASQFESLQRRFATGIRQEKADPSSRLDYWRAARQLYARNPAWGIGPGHYDVEFAQVRPWRVQGRPEYVHNDYLNTLCEWGAVGVGIVAAACGLLAWGVERTWRAVRRPANDFGARKGDRTAFLLGASFGLLAVMIHCVVDFNMQIPADAITVVTLMALIAAQARFVTEGYWKNPGRLGKVLLTALAAGAVYYLAAEEIRGARETIWLRRAAAEKVSLDQAMLCLRQAHDIEPANPETDYLAGETLRLTSKDGNAGYQDKAKEAIQWFTRGMEVNPFDARFPLRVGMSLDWIGQTQEASPYFYLADRLDPTNYYIALEEGRHCVALGEFERAKAWMLRAYNLDATTASKQSLQLLMENMADPLFLPHK
jgi:O-antigen ligase